MTSKEHLRVLKKGDILKLKSGEEVVFHKHREGRVYIGNSSYNENNFMTYFRNDQRSYLRYLERELSILEKYHEYKNLTDDYKKFKSIVELEL
tara:strand:+ start:766 stop:1044 length:279 start_codon:yes stop_codon:yes gene_type:complete